MFWMIFICWPWTIEYRCRFSLPSPSIFRRRWVHWVWRDPGKPWGDRRRSGHVRHRLRQEQRPPRGEAVQHLQHPGSRLFPSHVADCFRRRSHGRREDLGMAYFTGFRQDNFYVLMILDSFAIFRMCSRQKMRLKKWIENFWRSYLTKTSLWLSTFVSFQPHIIFTSHFILQFSYL